MNNNKNFGTWALFLITFSLRCERTRTSGDRNPFCRTNGGGRVSCLYPLTRMLIITAIVCACSGLLGVENFLAVLVRTQALSFNGDRTRIRFNCAHSCNQLPTVLHVRQEQIRSARAYLVSEPFSAFTRRHQNSLAANPQCRPSSCVSHEEVFKSTGILLYLIKPESDDALRLCSTELNSLYEHSD